MGHDYLAFYMAGDMVHSGNLSKLYNVHDQQSYQQNFMRPINPNWQGTCLYLNPPHYAAFMSLLARFNYGPSLLLWTILSLLCFTATIFIWRPWIPQKDFPLVIVLAICMPSFFQALAGGQNSFLSLLILTGFCGLLLAGRDFWAGAVLSLLAFKFQFLIIPILILLAKKRWRTLSGIVTGTVLTLGLTFLFMGPQSLHDYLTFASSLGNLMQQKGFDTFKQHSWHGFFQLTASAWTSPVAIRALTTIFSFATLVLLILIWKKPWNPKSPDFSLQLSALISATLITSPHLFHYDMLLITLPAVLWFKTYRSDPNPTFDEPIKTLLATLFIWILLSAPAVAHLHLQLSPILLVCFLIMLFRRLNKEQNRVL